MSLGFQPGLALDQIAGLVDDLGSRGADLILLPETCRGQNHVTAETLHGPTLRRIASQARKHRTYIVCPLDRRHGGQRLNSAVLIDRQGNFAGVYDKIYPFFGQELSIDPPVEPGETVRVFRTDFGMLGIAICFDVNWPHLWKALADLGAELVVWPSAYSGGRPLAAHAIDNHYYIVSSTWVPDCRVFDIDGEEIAYQQKNAGENLNVTHVTLDFDRCLFHFDFHHPGKLDKLLDERGDDVAVEKWLATEAWFVLRAKRPGISARELARQYGLIELRDYIRQSGDLVDARRPSSRSRSASMRG